MSRPFDLSCRLRSFKFAVQGIGHLMRTQPNAWIHLAATMVTVGAGFMLGLSMAEWCWMVLAMTGVWVAEAMNTALELLCDATTTEFHPLIGRAKDVAAGAVLLAALGAFVVGVIVFLPKMRAFVQAA